MNAPSDFGISYDASCLFCFITVCAQEEYLNPTCTATFSNDYVTLVRIMDLDKDGVLDVLAGTSINGLVYDYVYEGVDCAADWSPKWMYNAGGDVRSIYVLDVDKDGKNEVLVSSATSSISGNRPEANMLVLRDNGVIEWAEDKVGGLMNSVYAVDMDNDGSPDVWSDRTSTFTCLIVLVI